MVAKIIVNPCQNTWTVHSTWRQTRMYTTTIGPTTVKKKVNAWAGQFTRITTGEYCWLTSLPLILVHDYYLTIIWSVHLSNISRRRKIFPSWFCHARSVWSTVSIQETALIYYWKYRNLRSWKIHLIASNQDTSNNYIIRSNHKSGHCIFFRATCNPYLTPPHTMLCHCEGDNPSWPTSR